MAFVTFIAMNYLAIIGAAAAAFLFGGIWYGLLSSQWMAASGLAWEAQEAKTGTAAARPYIVTIVAELAMATALAWLMAHLDYPGVSARRLIVAISR